MITKGGQLLVSSNEGLEENVKLYAFRRDFRELSKVVSFVNNINVTFTKILNQFKNIISIQDNLQESDRNQHVKRFNTIFALFTQITSDLKNQTMFYKQNINNLVNDKKLIHQQFKKQLLRYEQRRKKIKIDIQQMQIKMQQVQTSTKQMKEQQFAHVLSYVKNSIICQKSLKCRNSISRLLARNALLRAKVLKCKVNQPKLVSNLQLKSTTNTKQFTAISALNLMQPSCVSKNALSVLDVTELNLCAKDAFHQSLFEQVLDVRDRRKEIQIQNTRIRKAIVELNCIYEQKEREYRIEMHKNHSKENVEKGDKLTSTDYLIYLKALQTQVNSKSASYFYTRKDNAALSHVVRIRSQSVHLEPSNGEIKAKQYNSDQMIEHYKGKCKKK